MMKMNKYNKHTSCIKCGEDQAHTEYRLSRNELSHDPKDHVPHLLRTCAICGFSWEEAPLDA